MNLSVTHKKKKISKAFLELTAQNVDKFYYFIPPNIMYDQPKNIVRDGLRQRKTKTKKVNDRIL